MGLGYCDINTAVSRISCFPAMYTYLPGIIARHVAVLADAVAAAYVFTS